MSKFGDFMNNMFSIPRNLVNKYAGTGMTDADREANAFTAAQTMKQMQFQQQMRDTAYQAAVADMKKAGINPALAYQQGGADVPAGAAGNSVTPTQGDLVGLAAQIAQLKLLGAQKRNIESVTAKNLQDVNESKSRIEQMRANIEHMAAQNSLLSANVQKLGLESDALSIANTYLEREKLVALQNQNISGDLLAAQVTETENKIYKLHVEALHELEKIVETKERVNYLLSQTSLTNEQKKEVVARIKQIEESTELLVKQGVLTDKDINWYVHDKIAGDVGTIGSVFSDVTRSILNLKNTKYGYRR
jgi:hypothetical protein